MNSTTTPRIYVACLASYNNGDLHGAWIDAAQEADTIREEIANMLSHSKHPNVMVKCPDCAGRHEGLAVAYCQSCLGKGEYPSAEEWAIHDYEGFAGVKVSEWHDIDEIAELAALIEEHDEDLIRAAFEASDGNKPDDIRTTIEDRYRGTCDSKADYAADMIGDCYDLSAVPEFIRNHINYDGIARDMEIGGDVTFIRSGWSLYVFDNNA